MSIALDQAAPARGPSLAAWLKRRAAPLIVFAALFVFWEFAVHFTGVKEYLLPPLILAVIYATRGLLATPPRGHVELLFGKNLEALLCVIAGIVLLYSFTMVLGLHVGLGVTSSRVAVGQSLGSVFFLSVGTLICIYLILINGRFEYQWLTFSGFIFAGVGGTTGKPSDHGCSKYHSTRSL